MSRLAPVWTEVVGQSEAAVGRLYKDGLHAAWVIPTARNLIEDLAAARTNRADGQTQLRHTRAFWTGVLAAATRQEVVPPRPQGEDESDSIVVIDASTFAEQAASGLGVIGVQVTRPVWRGEIGNLAARNCRIVGGGLADVDAQKLGFWACSLVQFSIERSTARIVDLSDARVAGIPKSRSKLRVNADGEFRARSTLMRFVEVTIRTATGAADFAESDLSSRRHPDSDALMALAAPDREPQAGGAVRFKNCGLEQAKFDNCWLEGVVFDNCTLSGASFAGAEFDSRSRILPSCSCSDVVLPQAYPSTLFGPA